MQYLFLWIQLMLLGIMISSLTCFLTNHIIYVQPLETGIQYCYLQMHWYQMNSYREIRASFKHPKCTHGVST